MDLELIHKKAFNSLPIIIQAILSDFTKSYILGGFGISHLRGETPKDIDLFVPHVIACEVLERLSGHLILPFRIYDIIDSCHVGKILIEGIEIDLVSFGPEFNPKTHSDFHCRMVQFTKESFVFPTLCSRQDIRDGKLRYNNEYKLLTRIVDLVHDTLLQRNKGDSMISGYECSTLTTLTMNVEKYKSRGWVVLIDLIPSQI